MGPLHLMIVVDVETTGTHPDRHAILSIGAVDFEAPARQFFGECRIWDGALIESDALAVNGFTPEQATDPARPAQEELLGRFISFCRDTPVRVLGGFNTAFDRDFLQAAAVRCNLDWLFGHRVLDLHSFAWMHIRRSGAFPPLRSGRSRLSASDIMVYCGLPPEPKPHHGLTGAKMEAESFSRLLRGRGLLDEYAAYPVPDALLPGATTRGQASLL